MTHYTSVLPFTFLAIFFRYRSLLLYCYCSETVTSYILSESSNCKGQNWAKIWHIVFLELLNLSVSSEGTFFVITGTHVMHFVFAPHRIVSYAVCYSYIGWAICSRGGNSLKQTVWLTDWSHVRSRGDLPQLPGPSTLTDFVRDRSVVAGLRG